MIERDSRPIDLAQTGGSAGNLGHQRRFAEAHFAQALGEAVIAINLANPAGCADGELAEWEEKGARGRHEDET